MPIEYPETGLSLHEGEIDAPICGFFVHRCYLCSIPPATILLKSSPIHLDRSGRRVPMRLANQLKIRLARC